jgi:hypothetical protein
MHLLVGIFSHKIFRKASRVCLARVSLLISDFFSWRELDFYVTRAHIQPGIFSWIPQRCLWE